MIFSNWKKLIDENLISLEGSSVYSRFRKFLPVLSKCGFFSHLGDESFENYRLFASQLRYLGNSSHSSAFGLGLAGMAMANLCGQILKRAGRKNELKDLVEGRKIFSIGVSEKGWKGRLHNIQTKLKNDPSANIQFLSGEKNFATNGRQADTFIIIAKNDFDEFVPIVLNSNQPGLEIMAFDLSVGQEATHAELTFRDIKIETEAILDTSYKEMGRYLPHWEKFCFQLLCLGLFDRIISNLSDLNTSSEIKSEIPLSVMHKKELPAKMKKEHLSLEEKIMKRWDMISESGMESLRLKDGLYIADFYSEYFSDKEWERMYPPLLLLRKLLPAIH